MKNIKLPYRYDYVGSFLRPDDLKKIRADYEAGKTTYEALKEAGRHRHSRPCRKTEGGGL